MFKFTSVPHIRGQQLTNIHIQLRDNPIIHIFTFTSLVVEINIVLLKKKTGIIGTKNLRREERILIKKFGDNQQCTRYTEICANNVLESIGRGILIN